MASTSGVALEPIEGLIDTDKFLKVPLLGTFKNLSGFYDSARLYRKEI